MTDDWDCAAQRFSNMDLFGEPLLFCGAPCGCQALLVPRQLVVPAESWRRREWVVILAATEGPY